jgi:DNA-binding NarL/FixJ family response regulator
MSSGSTWFIRNYLFEVFDRLGVSTRVELVLYYLQYAHAKTIAADD